jgi:hypothetical protein
MTILRVQGPVQQALPVPLQGPPVLPVLRVPLQVLPEPRGLRLWALPVWELPCSR